ncbi:hypothetical protein [Streptomyces minutiscleroticus]|uniref:Secreted protein n=1 Tax=Streptomyces minutiscleroticus TaxID=68238 RepID=A0A918NRK7_9ACTN|nr:hypothetical protein [Streptomyces minutiscleroticus]GGX90403.1 hypothetical protein GCM10010358_50480 [Streptomyces minutiscleroticus]
MSRRPLRTLLALGGAAAVVALTPLTAQAAPAQGGNYGAYANEGQYPTISSCAGTFRQIGNTLTFEGMSLKYFYSDRCGSFARIENSRQNCSAVLERSNSGAGNADAWVAESVDPGINYAYTKIGNNLNGRVSRALLVCDGHPLLNTGWF